MTEPNIEPNANTDTSSDSGTGSGDTDPPAAIADQLHLRCADAVEVVTDYLDDALSAQDLAVFEAHVARCEGCTVFVDQVQMTIELTGRAGAARLEFMPANFDTLLAELQSRATPPSGDPGTSVL